MTRGHSWSLAFTMRGLAPLTLYRLLPALSVRPHCFGPVLLGYQWVAVVSPD